MVPLYPLLPLVAALASAIFEDFDAIVINSLAHFFGNNRTRQNDSLLPTMTDLGHTLSNLLGDHKVATDFTETNYKKYRSSTTNSYNKCIKEIAHNFSPGIQDIAIKAIDRYDQNNFDETVELDKVYKFNQDTGSKYLAGVNVLRIKGTYQFRIFAHCKTVEMWIEFKPK